jgi:hypothetical protein
MTMIQLLTKLGLGRTEHQKETKPKKKGGKK